MKINFSLPKLRSSQLILAFLALSTLATFYLFSSNYFLNARLSQITKEKVNLEQKEQETSKKLEEMRSELETLKNEDQIKRNEALETEIKDINKTYQESITLLFIIKVSKELVFPAQEG